MALDRALANEDILAEMLAPVASVSASRQSSCKEQTLVQMRARDCHQECGPAHQPGPEARRQYSVASRRQLVQRSRKERRRQRRRSQRSQRRRLLHQRG